MRETLSHVVEVKGGTIDVEKFGERWFILREAVESFLLFQNDALLASTTSFQQALVAR